MRNSKQNESAINSVLQAIKSAHRTSIFELEVVLHNPKYDKLYRVAYDITKPTVRSQRELTEFLLTCWQVRSSIVSIYASIDYQILTYRKPGSIDVCTSYSDFYNFK